MPAFGPKPPATPTYSCLNRATTHTALPALSDDSRVRKNLPIFSGVLNYFPDAIAYIAHVSKVGNDKHSPGQPLHWSRDKSNDHLDCVARHLVDAGTVDPKDNLRHSGTLAWRALANLQVEIESLSPEDRAKLYE